MSLATWIENSPFWRRTKCRKSPPTCTTMCQVSNDQLAQQLAGTLNVVRDKIDGAGGVSVAGRTVTWNAVNQYTQVAETVSLPAMNVGGKWLGQVYDAETSVPRDRRGGRTDRWYGHRLSADERAGRHAPRRDERAENGRYARHRHLHSRAKSGRHAEPGGFLGDAGRDLPGPRLCGERLVHHGLRADPRRPAAA